MDFSRKFNEYIKEINCSSKELSEKAEMSPAVISRYRSGNRTPNLKNKQVEKLSIGLEKMAKEKNIKISKDTIFEQLSSSLNSINISPEQMQRNFNELINILNINISELSRAIGFDASLISRIRTGKRNPAKPKEFINSICKYITHKYISTENLEIIANLINCNSKSLQNQDEYLNKLERWFSSNISPSHNCIDEFLKNLDCFNLDEYIKAIHFYKIKIPFVPFYKISTKHYYGLKGMRQGELDFFKGTILSKSTEPIFMCSDMPMEDMAKDIEFGKKWMYAIAISIKKSLHLNIIHNIDRPFDEMMLGLESWIPIYMTGQVSPYYLANNTNNVYQHLNYVSGSVALTGECIKSFHNDGKYYLTNKKEELSYFKNKAKLLLKKAKPLMEIYNIENKEKLRIFLKENSIEQGKRHNILSSLPTYTISLETLKNILDKNNISDENKEIIKNHILEEKKEFANIIEANEIIDDISKFPPDEFEKYPIFLSLTGLFLEKQITYTYEDYLKHFNETITISKNHQNYNLKISTKNAFRNINIFINYGNSVMISKNNIPTINFIIKHPKLRTAIENFKVPVIE